MSDKHVTLTLRPVNVVFAETPEKQRAADELTLAHHVAALKSGEPLPDPQRLAAAAAIGRMLHRDYPEGAPSKHRRNVWIAVAYLAARDHLGDANAAQNIADRCIAMGVAIAPGSVEKYGRTMGAEARASLERFFTRYRDRAAVHELASAAAEGAFSAIRQLSAFERRK